MRRACTLLRLPQIAANQLLILRSSSSSSAARLAMVQLLWWHFLGLKPKELFVV